MIFEQLVLAQGHDCSTGEGSYDKNIKSNNIARVMVVSMYGALAPFMGIRSSYDDLYFVAIKAHRTDFQAG